MTAYNVSDSNLFAYCGNNPVLRGDAEGEFWNVVIGAAAGVLVNVVSVAVQGAITGEKPQHEDYLLAVITGAVSGGVAGAGIFVTPGQHAILGGVTSFIGSLQENGEDLGSGDPGRAGGALLNIVIDTAVGATFGYVGGTTGKASTSKIRSIWGGTKAFLRNVAENGISSGGSIIASVTTKGVYQNTYNSFRYARLK